MPSFKTASYCFLPLVLSVPFGIGAQEWPRQKPITFAVAFAPASTTDIVGRVVGQKLAEVLGQGVHIENKAGAGGNIGAQLVKRAAPDGYTVLVTSVAYAVNPSLYANAGYDPARDFIPVVLGPSTPNIITVNPAVAATNVKELVELARKSKLAYSCCNDASIRDYQRKSNQWTIGKNFDGTGPLGPCLVTPDELPAGCAGLRIQSRLNGKIMQDANTRDLLWNVVETLVLITECMTLEPGDVIITGTPAGVGYARNPPVFMAPGDVCEVEIEGVGILSNPIADET